MSKLLTLFDETRRGADVSFNGPMLSIPYELARLGATYTRASTKTVYQNDAIVTLASGQFGTTYDSVTGLYAYDPEPAATNLATNSAGAAATWTVSNVVDAATPISGFAASLQFGDNSVQRSATKSISVTSGTTYSISVFIQMDDDSAPSVGSTNSTGDLSITLNAVIATANLLVKRIGQNSNIYRISGSIVASATASHAAGFIKYTGQSAKPFRIIGIQVETGIRATSYIATAGATATRNDDRLSVMLSNIQGFSSSGFTLFVDAREDIVITSTSGLIGVNDGTTSNRALIRGASTANIQTVVSTGGIIVANTTESAIGTSRFKAAYSCAVNSFLRAVNGVSGTSDTAGAMPVSPTTLNIGHEINVSQTNGYIFSVRLIPTALNQAMTTSLTT